MKQILSILLILLSVNIIFADQTATVFDTLDPNALRLVVEPDPVEFGYNLEIGREYIIDATFFAPEEDTVVIQEIQIARTGMDYLTVQPTAFLLHSGIDQEVIVTFQTDVSIDLYTRMRIIIFIADQHNQYAWDVHASTYSNGFDEPGNDGLGNTAPNEFHLVQICPNPFNTITRITFGLPEAADVKISIFDLNGRLVERIVSGRLNAGDHTAVWDAGDAASGIYLLRMETPVYKSVQKVMLMK